MVDLLSFIVAISVLVAAHEFGHYWVARRLGFKVLRFSIGFGKPLLVRRGGPPDHTEYWLSSIPLGGYVKMLDEREEEVESAERHRAFNQRPIWQRIAVLLAGPAFNFLFAIAACWLMFVTGVDGVKAVIGGVDPDTVAARAGLEAGDQIVAVGGRETATWENATLQIFEALLADGQIELTVRSPSGATRGVRLDVAGREAELTEPAALYTGLGIQPGPVLPATIGEITPDMPAAAAGFMPGDTVVGAGDTRIERWEQWVEYVRAHPNEAVDVTVLRDGAQLVLPLTIGSAVEQGKTIGKIGAGVQPLAPEVIESLRAEQRFGLIEAAPRAVQRTWEMVALTVRMLTRMITGGVSLKNMSGPLSIADYAGDSAQAGLAASLSFLALVSISLGIFNLLPIPLLDGGQVVYQIAEWFKGAPLSERAMLVGQQLGLLLLIALMSFAFYNDLSRMFGS
jgi:regulator of sigma E protease